MMTERGSILLDAGDVGGDIQTGPSAGRRFAEHIAGDAWAVLDFYAYPAEENGQTWIQMSVHYTECTDPDAPGDTERFADIAYWDGPGTEPGATAEGLIAGLTREDLSAAVDQLTR